MRNWKKIVASAFALFALADLPAHASAIGEIEMRPSSKTTYMATTGPFTAIASATDMAQLYGSASKTIRIHEIIVSYYGAPGTTPNDFYLIKRSTANSSGTPTTPTVIPLDSNNAAGTGVVKYYPTGGANPTTGTAVGTINVVSLAPTYWTGGSGASGDATELGGRFLYKAPNATQAITLRGTGEGLVINNNGTTVVGTSPKVSFTFVWTEE